MTLFHRNANSPVMRDLEALVYRAVDAGEVVNHRVKPIYDGAGMPTHVAVSARGSNGFSLDVTIANRNALAPPPPPAEVPGGAVRERGAGRPTKRERREIVRLRGH